MVEAEEAVSEAVGAEAAEEGSERDCAESAAGLAFRRAKKLRSYLTG